MKPGFSSRPSLHKLNLLTILDIGPFSAYCCAYAHWQQAEEALQRSGELTIKTTEGHPRVNPLVRIASQAMDDMRRIGAEFGLSPNARLRLRVQTDIREEPPFVPFASRRRG